MQTEGLRRGIGPLGAALISFNGIVGAGIFMLPGLVHAEFGAFGPWLFPVFGLAHLLGINLMPRIRNIKDLVFSRPEPGRASRTSRRCSATASTGS